MGKIKVKQEPIETRRIGTKQLPPPHWIDWDGDYVRQIDPGKKVRELNYGKPAKLSVPVQSTRLQEEEDMSEFKADSVNVGMSKAQEEVEVCESSQTRYQNDELEALQEPGEVLTGCDSDSLSARQSRLQELEHGFQVFRVESESEECVKSESATSECGVRGKVFFKAQECAGVKRKADELSYDDYDFDMMDIDDEEKEGPEVRDAKRIRLC